MPYVILYAHNAEIFLGPYFGFSARRKVIRLYDGLTTELQQKLEIHQIPRKIAQKAVDDKKARYHHF